ncbi:WcaI family glycosyltransferase [Qipengyuania sp. GH38]|uniref:WcaI family glycosyltransferase n=1 Tax=Qipengyuania intermedia TaxID=2867244 RepID=UPI001C872317|nr:WcaI family glycosyltransferase [Qipengyuania intermedia]MBX7514173.1 WcaI family glycosyltransferase [Qipengyuania intermedia]
MATRKILFIGLNYAPEPIGIGPYSTGLMSALARRGHQVHAVVGQPYYPDWKMHSLFRGRWRTATEEGVKVTRCPHYIPSTPTGRRRLVHHLSFASSCYPAARLARRELRPDLVFTVAPSLIAAPVAARMAKRSKVPLWLHIQDFEVGAALATGLLESGAVGDAALQFERRVLSAADVVSTISKPMQQLLIDKGVPPERVRELRNWANHDRAQGRRDFRAEWQLDGRFVALYSGNIANKQGLDIMIEAAKFLTRRPDIHFVICGEGPNRTRLQELATGLDNLTFHELQPSEDVGDLLHFADLHLLPQVTGAKDLMLPSKLGNMLASGRPTIATTSLHSGLAEELDGAGAIVPPGDAQALAWAIERLAGDREACAAMGQRAREVARLRWSKETVVDAFENTMEELLA